MASQPDGGGLSDADGSGNRQQSCKAFYAEHALDVFRIVQHVVQDLDLAKEATDEAFCKAFERWESFGPEPRQRRAWVIKVAVNHASSWRRRLERRRAYEARAADQQRVALVAVDENQALLLEVRAALALLPRQQRAVMALRYLCDLHPKEVAEILGISVRTAGVHEHRARKRLRAALNDQEGRQ